MVVVGIERLGGGSNTTSAALHLERVNCTCTQQSKLEQQAHKSAVQQCQQLRPTLHTHTTTLLGVLQHVFSNKNKGLSYCAVPITQQSHHMSPPMVT